MADRGAQQLRAQPPLDVRRRGGPNPLPGDPLLRGEPRRLRLRPVAAHAHGGAWWGGEGSRAGAGGGGLHPAELPRQQALELPDAGLRTLAVTAARSGGGGRWAPILWISPFGGISCRRWSSTA